MRILTIGLLAATALGCFSTAHAADFNDDYLRGPDYEPVTTQIIDWSGGYIGGHGGYSSSAFGFKSVFQPIVASALRSTVIESELNASSLLATHDVRKGGVSYGAFAGYNMQFDEAVIGVEFDYTRFDTAGVSADAIARTRLTSDGYQSTVILSGTSRTKIEDLGTIRARAGYAIDNFLPFVTGGFAIGRARIGDSVNVQGYAYDKTTYQSNVANAQSAYVGNYGYSSFDQTNPGAGVPAAADSYGSRKTKVVGGLALGAGLEYAITSNILLRGEYQYVLLNDFDGHKININTVRGWRSLQVLTQAFALDRRTDTMPLTPAGRAVFGAIAAALVAGPVLAEGRVDPAPGYGPRLHRHVSARALPPETRYRDPPLPPAAPARDVSRAAGGVDPRLSATHHRDADLQRAPEPVPAALKASRLRPWP